MKNRKLKIPYEPSTDDDKYKKQNKYAPNKNDMNKLILIPIAVLIAFCCSLAYSSWLTGKVNTPLHDPNVVESDSYRNEANLDRYWGTYRPNLYFGLKTRSANPLSVGMVWFNQMNPKFHLRHWCNQNDGLAKYGWTAHDGRNFGIHEIYESPDNRFTIRNSYVKRAGGVYGGDWSVKTEVTPFSADEGAKLVSVFFYFAKNNTGWIKSTSETSKQHVLDGETDDLGKFRVKIDTNGNQNLFVNTASLDAPLALVTDTLVNSQYFNRIAKNTQNIKEYIGLRGVDDLHSANTIVYQVSGMAPFQFQVIFESESLLNESKKKHNGRVPKELNGIEFDGSLSKAHNDFQNKFERVFALRAKQLSEKEVRMAQAAFSNLIGGIGFFTGQSIVQSLRADPVLYWQSNLYTAVPSRSFFPRGFLWDEGFHNILIDKWDSEITKDIIGHWLDLMNAEGWIPREVILGDEARAKVPHEFWVQNNQYANPPTLFIPLDELVTKIKQNNAKNPDSKANIHDLGFLNRIYPRLKHWYNWFNTTQNGKLPLTYRWRGRQTDVPKELNPKTLTSGLDDYPRASHPNDLERHLDLRCWMALASKVMGNIAEIVGKLDESKTYNEHFQVLSDNKLLDALHWSGTQYADYGLHSDRIKLVRPPPRPDIPPQQQQQQQMIRKVEVEPQLQYINSVGYVSLFPMLIQLLKPDSEKLNAIFDQIKDPQQLWTPYGLRSLGKSAPLYNKRNTEHDPPYWRGPIWININYLTLKSLKYYSTLDGPYKVKATEVYNDLRSAVMKNILENYSRTGYIWEQYNDVSGKGQGSHPFTGWSALVTLIMAEKY